MPTKKRYSLNQSPLYKLNTKKRLVSCLGLKDTSTLGSLLAGGDENYYISKLKEGRVIEVPLPQLCRVHKKLNQFLTRIHIPDYLNSGVKGRSNVKNARDHLGNHALQKLDIVKYYQSITTEQVYRCFVKQFRCSKDIARILARLCTVGGHIPTGSSISQSLAFSVNQPMFDHINRYSKARGIKFTCYVDDLTFSGKVFPKSFRHYIESYIEKSRGYSCHKGRRYLANTPKPVTGIIIDGDALRVMNCHRKKISDLQHKYNFMINNYAPTDDTLIKYFQCLQGHLFSAGQINVGYRKRGKAVVSTRQRLSIPAHNKKI